MSDKVVLGGGLSGLIYAYYHKDHIIISPDIGGKMDESGKDFFSNIIFAHYNNATIRLLNDIGIPYSRATRPIVYIVKEKADNMAGWKRVVLDKSMVSIDVKLKIIRKKMRDPSFEPLDLNLSTDDYYIDTLDFSISDLVRRLSDKIMNEERWHDQTAIRITKEKVVTSDTSFPYSRLISTIPADIFWKIHELELDCELKSGWTTFALSDRPTSELRNIQFNIAYDATDSACTRISHNNKKDNDVFLYEFAGKLDEHQVESNLPLDAKLIQWYSEPRGVIFTNSWNVPPPNTIFVGRFAQWKHSIKLGDVIESALFDCDVRTIFNRQLNFTKNFFDLDKLRMDTEYRQESTRSIMLLLYPELGEILNAINYKAHRKRRDVNEEHVKEEIVDSFKYLLNLMIIWGIDSQELFELFSAKSKIVEDRYREKVKDET